MDGLLCYLVIKQAFEYKTRVHVFTLRHSLNRGIHLSPIKINMRNSVIQALLTCTHFNKTRMRDLLMISLLLRGLIIMLA